MSTDLTQKEQEKLQIINQTLAGTLTNERAAVMLGITIRQVQRLKKKVRTEGENAVVHKLKGKQSNHHIEPAIKAKALKMIKEQELQYLCLPEKPKKQRIKQPVILTTHTLNYKPPANHPWRQYQKQEE